MSLQADEAPDGMITIPRSTLDDIRKCAERLLHVQCRSALDATVQHVTNRLIAAHLDDRRDLQLQLRQVRRERDKLRDELEALKSPAKEGKKPARTG